MGTKTPHSILVHDLLRTEIRNMERGILIPVQTPYRHFSNFFILKMRDFAKQSFKSKLAFD